MGAMVSRVVPVRVGQVVVLAEALVPPGSEQTSSGALGRAGDKAIEAFDAAQEVMVELAVKVAGSVAEMGKRAVSPDEVAVEFGLTFATNGSIVLAGASAAASLKVTITYQRHGTTATNSGGTVSDGS